jgi:signal transduction histidine kinase
LQAKEIIDAVIQDNKRASEIIRKLRNMFANPEFSEFAPLDLSQLLLDTVDLVKSKAKHYQIEIVLDVDAKIFVRGDLTQLQQVVLNLLNNALDALIDSSKSPKILKISLKLEDSQVYLSIQDNADGMPDDIKDSVFQLFKTSKASGMGVGLWLSQTVIHGHGGIISFETLQGVGTTFTVKLPR